MKNPQCANCGGTDYILESGFYFCSECNVQSQDIIEQVYDFFSTQVSQVVSKKVAAPNQNDDTVQIESSTVARKVLTSWQVLNHILVGLVNELELLGASAKLKKIAMKLWALYLMKLEVAFLSQHVQKKPRLGVLFRRNDAELVYGAPADVSRAHKRPIYRPKRKYVKSASAVSDNTSRTSRSSRSEKYRMSLKRKALAKAEYMESESLLSQSSVLTLETLSDRSLSQASSQRSHRLRYTKHAKRSFKSLLLSAKNLDEDERKDVQTRLMVRECNSPRHITMMKVVAILRLALILSGEDIHVADIFRWNAEGYLSLSDAVKLLPADATVEKDVKALFDNRPCSRQQIELNVTRLSKLLDLQQHVTVNLRTTIARYCDELALPDHVLTLIDKLISLKPMEVKLMVYSNYEGRAMAMIIFLLKLLFGLDGVTERKLSVLSTKLQAFEDGVSFNWLLWTKFINARTAVCSYYHPSIREKYFPNSRVGGPDPFLSQWDNTPVRQLIHRQHVINYSVRDSIRRALRNLLSETVQPFRPSSTPLSSTLHVILERKDANIATRVRSLLETDFRQHSLNYLVSPLMEDYVVNELKFAYSEELGNEYLREKPQRYLRNYSRPVRSMNVKKLKLRFTDALNCETDSLTIGTTTFDHSSVNESSRLSDNVYYFPKDYWLYSGNYSGNRGATLELFETLAQDVFPASFLWLLRQCAHVIGQPVRDVYVELLKVEKFYLSAI